MPERVKVIDKVTGVESFVPVGDFDPTDHEVVEGQVATVAPLGGDEFAAGQAVTERSLAGDALLPQFSPEARAELTAEQVEESTFDTTGNIVEQAVRGGAAGLTFGLSELVLAEDDPFKRERQRRKRAAAPGTFAIGQAVGGIAPALLSGGAGALGAAARLTPSGRVAANVARWTSGSPTLAGRAVRSAVGDGFQGGVEFVGDRIANEVIQENPQFSAEALASDFGLGAVVGGGISAVSGVLGAGLRRAKRARATPGDALGRLADAPAVAFERQIRDAPVGRGKFDRQLRSEAPDTFSRQLRDAPALRHGIELGDVVGRGARGKADNAYRDLVTHIDDAGTKSFVGATKTTGRLTSQLDELGLPDAIAMNLKTGLKEVSSQYVDAGTRARRWISDASDELGIPPSKMTAKKLNELSPDLEDRGIAALSELDEAQSAWNRASSEVEAGVSDTLSGAGAVAAGQPSGGLIANASARFGGMAKKIRAGNVGTAIGVAEGARDLGIDIPLPSVRDIPLVGDALSLLTKMKALSRATGMVPATKATRAAQSVTSTRDRVGSAIKQAGRTATRIAAKPIVRNVTARSARAVAREILEVRNTTPADVEASAHESIDAPMEIKQAAVATAVRAHQYLSDVAPVNPLAGTAAASSWVPTAQDQLDWTTRRDAVQNPNRAIRESMAGGFPDLAVEALREVYPALYEDTRSRLQQDANKLNKRLPPHQLQSIGRVYRVPLTLSQTDGYGAAVQASFAQGQANDREAVDRFSTRQKALRPVNPGTSAVSALTESPLQRLTV